MSIALLQALQITALGMGLVFGAIIVLWLMMVLLTSLIADKKAASEPAPEPAPLLPTERGEKNQAAAIAVAIALAEQENRPAHTLPTPPTSIVSAWQLGMRTRLLAEKGHTQRIGR